MFEIFKNNVIKNIFMNGENSNYMDKCNCYNNQFNREWAASYLGEMLHFNELATWSQF